MTDSKYYKFGVMFSLYIAQAIPMSFFSTIVPVIMRQENFSLELIGMIQFVKLPWIFKFLWAPTVDRYAQKATDYKKWIFTSELIYAVIIFGIAFLNLGTDFPLIIALVIIAFIASATQDIATDAYVILLLDKKERGLGNSMQSAGSFIGTMVGSGVLLIVYHYWGWKYLLFGLAIFVLIALIPLLFFRKNNEIPHRETKKITFYEIVSLVKVKGMIPHLLLIFFFYSGIIGILTMLKPYLVDMGFSAKKIGMVVGIWGTLFGALSAFGTGWIIKRVDRIRLMMIFASMAIFISLFFICITFQPVHSSFIYFGIVVLWITYGGSTVLVYTSSMDKVRKGFEGTDFTIQIILTHLGSLIIATQSGRVADLFGYRGLFYIESGLAIFTLILLFVLRNRLNYNERTE